MDGFVAVAHVIRDVAGLWVVARPRAAHDIFVGDDADDAPVGVAIYDRYKGSVQFVYATGSKRDGIVASHHGGFVNHDLTDFHASSPSGGPARQAEGAGTIYRYRLRAIAEKWPLTA